MENDDELIQIFIEESKEILEKIKFSLEAWKETEGEETKETLDAILRELHTLKGSARIIGLLGLSEYTHHLEQVIQKIRQNPRSSVLHQKTIKEMQPALNYLTAYIEDFATSRLPPSSVPPIVSLKNDDNHPLMLFTQKEERSPSLSQETIRVKTILFENLSHLAGQINVSRSHLEQNVRETINVTLQMAKEIKVLREQLCQLQAKTDVELQSVQDKIQEKYDEFDILEMDRYSFLQTATRSLNEKMNRLDVSNSNVIRGMRRMENVLLEQKRVGNRLEEGVTHVRLISIESLVPRLKRMIQQVSEELGKEVRLECIRIEGEVDKQVLEKLISSLEHMIRNAIDHGIETPEVRKEIGKPRYGIITLSLFRQRNEMVIQLGDDGQGIDAEKVRLKAIEKGLWDPNEPFSEADMVQIICLPGFSSRDFVTAISGRGIGLDVVHDQVSKLGGVFGIHTKRHVGTQSFIRLPFTLSLSQALVFMVGEQQYALQLSSLVGLSRMMPIQKIKKIQYAKKSYDVFYLEKMLGESARHVKSEKFRPVIFLSSQSRQVALVVDKLIGSHELKVKPPGTQLQFLKEISGVSLLGDNQIVLILDPLSLIQKLSETAVYQREKKRTKQKILIVDDSEAVRHVTFRLLHQHQFEPFTAKDGVEALASFEKVLPDLVLLDIEMPNMDGFEVISRMKAEPKYQHIPIIMITSRSGEKHRIRAMQMGVTAYLSKPYIEDELLALLKKLLS